MVADLQRYYIEKYQLEENPLLTVHIATQMVQLYRQKKTGWLSCMTLYQKKVSASLHDGPYGSTRVHRQRIVYGFLPSDAVSVGTRSNQYTILSSADVFLLSIPISRTAILSFKSRENKLIQELEIPAWPRKSLRTRLKHMLHNLSFLPPTRADRNRLV